MTIKPVKYAVMLNGMYIREFQAESLKILNESGLAQVVAIIIPAQNTEKPPIKKKLLTRDRLYTILLNRVFKVDQEKNIPLPSFLQNVKIIVAKTCQQGKFSTFFEPDTIGEIADIAPDFILRFGFNIIRGEILNIAPWGIWSFHHGDERKYRGGPFVFWEIFRGDFQTGVIFQQLKNQLDGGNVFERRLYSTVFHSYREMRAKLLGDCTDMPLRALKSVINNNYKPVFLPDKEKGPVYKNPSNAAMLVFMLKLWKNRIRYYRQKYFRHESWGIAVLADDQNIPFQNSPLIPSQIIIPADKNLFYADCFWLNRDTILAEQYSYKEAKGKIVSINPADGEKQVFYEKSYHLAYPFVYRESGQVMLMFEQSVASVQEISEFKEGKLSLPVKISDDYLVDASLLKQDDYYYLFASKKGSYPNEKLYIYYSSDIRGPYFPHDMNPVKTDSTGARMAGQFINIDGDLIRPAQNSERYYGESIKLFRIVELSKSTYLESEYGKILPPLVSGKQAAGTHTISVFEGKGIVDFKFHRFIFHAFRAKLLKRY